MRKPELSGEALAAVSGIALCIEMVALEWYGVAGPAGPFASRSEVPPDLSGWQALPTLRWLMLLTLIAAIGSYALRVVNRFERARSVANLATMALGAVTAALLVYRVLIHLPRPDSVIDSKAGAFLGVLSAFGIALGGYESWLRTRRSTRVVVQRPRT